MTAMAVHVLALFLALAGLALIIGGQRLGGRVIGKAGKAIVLIVGWALRQILRAICFVLGAGIRSLTRPRPKAPRY